MVCPARDFCAWSWYSLSLLLLQQLLVLSVNTKMINLRPVLGQRFAPKGQKYDNECAVWGKPRRTTALCSVEIKGKNDRLE